MNPPEDSSSDASGEDESDISLTRQKRGIDWCGVEDEEPPAESSQATRKLPYYGNPNFSNRMQLYSRTKHFLAVYPDGSVCGTKDPNDLHTYLELRNAGPVGYVRILGLLTRLYVAMDKHGRLYAENNMWIEGTVFVESLSREGYKTYLSGTYPHWYLGVKRSGKFKKGPKTGPHQKAIEFLSVRSKFE